MSNFTETRTKAIEEVVVILKRTGRRLDPKYTELDAWRRLLASRKAELSDVAGTDLEDAWRFDMELADRRIAALEGFARDGVRETYA